MRERERLRRAIKLPTYTLLAGKAGRLLLLLQATLKQLRRWWWHQHHWIWLVVVSSWSCTCPPSTWWCRSRRTTGRCSQSPLRASLRLELHVRHEHHHNLDDFYILLFHANFQNGSKNFPFEKNLLESLLCRFSMFHAENIFQRTFEYSEISYIFLGEYNIFFSWFLWVFRCKRKPRFFWENESEKSIAGFLSL